MPSVGGQDFQHAQIRASLQGVGAGSILINSFTAISYAVRATKNPVRDSQGNIRGFTVGQKEIDGSLTLLQSEWVSVRRQIMATAGVLPNGLQAGILTVSFDLVISYGNSLANMFTDKLFGVLFNEDKLDSKDDQMAIQKDVPLFITDVSVDDRSPIYYRAY